MSNEATNKVWKTFGSLKGPGQESAFRRAREPSPEDKAATYFPSSTLVEAVRVALYLGKPLLLSGEPGTGKSSVAYSVAQQLGLEPVLKFVAKTSSSATDLLYHYDAVGHFRSTAAGGENTGEVGARDYIRLEALGAAIAGADPDHFMNGLNGPAMASPNRPSISVVLIDEIDKAPRDFTNDLLDEIDRAEFRIPELGISFKASPELRPVVFITTNGERELPQAFLRRCIFQHLEFPPEDKLREIVSARMSDSSLPKKYLDAAINLVTELRKRNLQRPPSTPDLLEILGVLDELNECGETPPDDLMELPVLMAILSKTRNDMREIAS